MFATKRIDIFLDNHIGFGIRWRSVFYQLELSISIPFITVVFGLGAEA